MKGYRGPIKKICCKILYGEGHDNRDHLLIRISQKVPDNSFVQTVFFHEEVRDLVRFSANKTMLLQESQALLWLARKSEK